MWMNEHEVEEALRRFDDDTPNLREGAQVLDRLVRWTNNNSDGWPYWPKPARAANTLMGLLGGADRFDPKDISGRQLALALRPIKSFLTRQGVNHDEVLA